MASDTLKLIQQLIAYHEERVRAYLMVIEDLKRSQSKKRVAATLIEDAIELDKARRKKKQPPSKAWSVRMKQRTIAAKFFTTLKPGQTYMKEELTTLKRLGPYLKAGFFEKRGNNAYLRTNKPYEE